LNLKYDKLLSHFAFNFNLRRCIKVCAAGLECSARGVCGAMDPTGELSADADAEHSNNSFDACDAVNAACALTKLCGPTNGFKVCMSHELCVEGGCVEEATFDTSSYKVGRCRLNPV